MYLQLIAKWYLLIEKLARWGEEGQAPSLSFLPVNFLPVLQLLNSPGSLVQNQFLREVNGDCKYPNVEVPKLSGFKAPMP